MGWSRSQRTPLSISTVLRKSVDGTLKSPTPTKMASMNYNEMFFELAKQAMYREMAAICREEGYMPHQQKLATGEFAQLREHYKRASGDDLGWLLRGIQESAPLFGQR